MLKIVLFLTSALSILSINADWTPDPLCPYPSEHVTRFPNHDNCSTFWECYQGTKYIMQCPEGLEFNSELEECVASKYSNCLKDDTTTTESTTTTTGPYPPCPQNNTLIYFPCLEDCSKYWECFGGHAYLYNCPTGLWWHQEILECDYPGSFCNYTTTTAPTESTTTESSTTATEPTVTESTVPTTTDGNDPRCGQGGTSYWPQPGTCSQYVECVDGVSYIIDCPPNLYFSDRVKQCVYSYESECCKVYECA